MGYDRRLKNRNRQQLKLVGIGFGVMSVIVGQVDAYLSLGLLGVVLVGLACFASDLVCKRKNAIMNTIGFILLVFIGYALYIRGVLA